MEFSWTTGIDERTPKQFVGLDVSRQRTFKRPLFLVDMEF
jgi:hypothetical protein